MVQVEERRAISPAPTRASPIVWLLVGVTASILAVSAVPWERFCSPAMWGFPGFCFHAAAWSGSAALAGVLLDALCTAFVVLALARGWARNRRLPTGGFILFAACLALLAVKVSVVFVDAAQTTADQSGASPAFVGQWLGLALLLVGAMGLLLALAERASLSVTVFVLVTVMVIGALAVPYAWSGLAWWGGPLSPPRYLGGGNAEGIRTSPGRVSFFQSLLSLHNVSHVSPTLDGVKLIGSSPPFPVRGTYVIDGCISGEVTARNLSRCTVPLTGSVVSPSTSHWVVIEFVLPGRGLYRAGWTRVDYHVGPLHYELFRTDQMEACAPEPGAKHCPGDMSSQGP